MNSCFVQGNELLDSISDGQIFFCKLVRKNSAPRSSLILRFHLSLDLQSVILYAILSSTCILTR